MTKPHWHPSKNRGVRHDRWQGGHWIRPAKRQAIYKRDGHLCVWCGPRSHDLMLTLDHLVPVVHGGDNHSKNLVTACIRCNVSRQCRSVRAWLRWLEKAGEDVDAVARRLENVAEESIAYNEGSCRKGKRPRRRCRKT